MADIRINALPTTATDFASDDYIAIDGTTNGTRKLNAKTANLTFSDVTLGTSGPSVKSTLSARAPRQGLVFDGSTSGGGTTSIPAFGSSDFTVSAWLNLSDLSTRRAWIGGATNAFASSIVTSGSVWTTKENIVDNTGSTTLLTAGKFFLVTYTRSGTTGSYYINGVLSNTITDSNNYSVGSTKVGSTTGGAFPFSGQIVGVNAYNRALSASEVVALYEAGAPAGADYPATAAGVALNTSAWTADPAVTFTSTSGDNISITATSSAGYAYTAPVFAIKTGQTIRLSGSFTSIAGNPRIQLLEGGNVKSGLASITATGAEVVATGSSSSAKLVIYCSGSGVTVTGTGIVVTATGLLLAPDAAQAGGGLTWYDTSGNAANITLPASGVSWNVPSSRVLGGNWTTSGTLGVNKVAGGEASVASTLQITSPAVSETGAGGLEWKADVSNNGYGFRTLPVFNGVSSYDLYTQSRSNSASWTTRMSLTNSGNFLIGTTTDAGGKLQISKSNGGAVNGAANAAIYLPLDESNIQGPGTNTVIRMGGNLVLGANGTWLAQTNGTTALTLDSSQNATFAGNTTAKGTTHYFGADNSQRIELTSNNGSSQGLVEFYNRGTSAYFAARYLASSHTFEQGPIAINNTVQTAAGVSSTHKVTISIGGTTYYLLATNV